MAERGAEHSRAGARGAGPEVAAPAAGPSAAPEAEAALPPLYQGWITRVLGEPPPVERRATCLDCVQCAPDRPAEVAFNPRTKCCTYVPHLPNFLVGGLLADPDARLDFGRETVRARLRRGAGVSPLGLLVHPEDHAAYEAIVKAEGFGRSDALRCPHYIEEGGLCGVWLHRNAICSTWYCRHDAGDRGFQFWHAVETLLRAAETAVERHVAIRLRFGRPADEAEALKVLEAGGFGNWIEDIEGYYRACAERVRWLGWNDIVALDRATLEPLVAAVRRAHRRLKVPAVLYDEDALFAPARIVELGTDFWVTGYHRHAAVRVSKPQFDLLLAFRKGTVRDLLARAQTEGVSLTPPLLERLRLEDVMVQPAADLDDDEDEDAERGEG